LNPFTTKLNDHQPLIFWHTHTVKVADVKVAIEQKASIELDLAYNPETNAVYIGHPLNFYTEVKQLPLPNNIDLERAIAMLEKAPEVMVVLDLKDERVFPMVKKIITRLGRERIILHAFVKEWVFNYPEALIPEAHWQFEDIRLAKYQQLIKETNVNAIGAIRVFSNFDLENTTQLQEILKKKVPEIACLSIYLPGAKVASLAAYQQIVAAGKLPGVNWDQLNDKEKRYFEQIACIGATEGLQISNPCRK